MLAAVAAVCAAAMPAAAACQKLAFSVNDYGKDGPTKDAKDLLDKYIVTWTKEKGIAKYTVGKKDVKCELFLNFIVFDEHTCQASALVCWGDGGGPGKASRAHPRARGSGSQAAVGQEGANARLSARARSVRVNAAETIASSCRGSDLTSSPRRRGPMQLSAPMRRGVVGARIRGHDCGRRTGSTHEHCRATGQQTMQLLHPKHWRAAKGFANGVVAEGRQVFVAGQVGWNAEQQFASDDFVAQVEQALRNVVEVLAEAGAGPEHLARLTWYVTDKREYVSRLRRGRPSLPARHRPAFSGHDAGAGGGAGGGSRQGRDRGHGRRRRVVRLMAAGRTGEGESGPREVSTPLFRHGPVEVARAGGAAQPRQHAPVPQLAGDGGQRVQLVELGGRGQQEEENDVDRLAVDGLERDRACQARQDPERLADLAQARVRHRRPAADTGGAQLVALLDGAGHGVPRQIEGGSRTRRQLPQQAGLVARRGRRWRPGTGKESP